jgi:hypothetical protein
VRASVLAAGAAVALSIAGCALRRPAPLPPASPEALLERLAARRAAVTSVRARAHLKAGLSGLWVREALLVRRPDAVRVDVFQPFGLALALGVHGTRLWAYEPGARTRWDGAATPANFARFLGAPIAVGDAVDILLGMPPAREPAGTPTVTQTDAREYRLRVPLADGEQHVWFAGDTLVVVRAEEERAGQPKLAVAFGDYEDGFPRAIDVGTPSTDAGARIRFDAVEPNVPLDPALFGPPAAPRVLSLDAMAPAPLPGS